MKSIKEKYEFLSHTADIKFQAFGKDYSELFSNCAYAMTSVLIEPKLVKPNHTHVIEIEGESIQRLLYDFLEEFLYLMDAEFFILSKINFMHIHETEDGFELKSECYFDYAKNYDFSGDIKSITYHEMFIKKNKEKYTAQVVIDV
jgi:SHS2 domain-containing protein